MTPFRQRIELNRDRPVIGPLLGVLLGGLAGDELDVVGLVVERLQLGREAYGQLDVATDGRNWAKEAREEAVDQLIYECIGAIRAQSRPALVITGDIEWEDEGSSTATGEGGAGVRSTAAPSPVGGGELAQGWEPGRGVVGNEPNRPGR